MLDRSEFDDEKCTHRLIWIQCLAGAIQELELLVPIKTSDRKAILLANRSSGAGVTGLEEAVDYLREQGMTISPLVPDSPAQFPDLLRSKAHNADLIVIGGGDGTLNRCLPALLEQRRPLGILPMGTANDLARTLAIPANLHQAAQVIAKGYIRTIDVGMVNERPFFNVASIGFSAEVARFHRGDRKRRLRLLSYPLSWIDAYRTHRHFHATIACNEVRHDVKCTLVAVGNGRHYGGGMTICDDAEIDDGLLHVTYVKPTNLLGLARLLPSLRFGTLENHELADVWRARRIQVTTRKPRRINVDGELIGQTPASFSVRPAALDVFAPEPS